MGKKVSTESDTAGSPCSESGTIVQVVAAPPTAYSRLDTIERIARVFGAVAIPVVLGAGSLLVNSAVETRAQSAVYVEIALSVLSDPSSPSELIGYAVDVLKAQSPVPVPTSLEQSLRQGSIAFPRRSEIPGSGGVTYQDLADQVAATGEDRTFSDHWGRMNCVEDGILRVSATGSLGDLKTMLTCYEGPIRSGPYSVFDTRQLPPVLTLEGYHRADQTDGWLNEYDSTGHYVESRCYGEQTGGDRPPGVTNGPFAPGSSCLSPGPWVDWRAGEEQASVQLPPDRSARPGHIDGLMHRAAYAEGEMIHVATIAAQPAPCSTAGPPPSGGTYGCEISIQLSEQNPRSIYQPLGGSEEQAWRWCQTKAAWNCCDASTGGDGEIRAASCTAGLGHVDWPPEP